MVLSRVFMFGLCTFKEASLLLVWICLLILLIRPWNWRGTPSLNPFLRSVALDATPAENRVVETILRNLRPQPHDTDKVSSLKFYQPVHWNAKNTTLNMQWRRISDCTCSWSQSQQYFSYKQQYRVRLVICKAIDLYWVSELRSTRVETIISIS